MKYCIYNYVFTFSAKACGKPERVPYLALKSREAKITVSGLPVGTDFKDPSDYSKTQLLEILKNAKNITLK